MKVRVVDAERIGYYKDMVFNSLLSRKRLNGADVAKLGSELSIGKADMKAIITALKSEGKIQEV